MNVIDRRASLHRSCNQLRTAADEQVTVAIVRHQRNAVTPLAVSGRRVVADELIDYFTGLFGVVQLAFGLAHGQPANAHVEQLGAGP